jgi:hypothetical protein
VPSDVSSDEGAHRHDVKPPLPDVIERRAYEERSQAASLLRRIHLGVYQDDHPRLCEVTDLGHELTFPQSLITQLCGIVLYRQFLARH